MNRTTMLFSQYGLRYLSWNPALMESGRQRIASSDNKFMRRNCSSASGNPQALPHYPVPALKETLDKYLKTVEPHLSDVEFTKTIKVARDFEKGKGQYLQELLEDRGRRMDNWLSDWWLDNAYLLYRDPVVVYSSPGLIFPQVQFRGEQDRLAYAVKVIAAALNYKMAIDNGQMPVEKMGKAELDMQQYRKIFGTCRIPGVEKDSLVFNPDSAYIIVMHKGNYFKVPVYGGPNGRTILSEGELVAQLKACLSERKNHNAIGLLTSDSRNNWGRAYEALMKDDVNKESVRTIQNSLFVVALDDVAPERVEGYYNMACHQLITAGGSRENVGNRWYDKTVQFIIGETGINGLTYEHSPAEGQPIAILTDYIIGYVQRPATSAAPAVGGVQAPLPLSFNVTPEIASHLESAATNIDALSSNLDMYTLEFKEYGKNFIKSQKMSPDSFIQIAMQYAFYRLHAAPAAHYESAQTRLFIHGRTETIRSCSMESIAFAKAMVTTATDAERVQKLRAAVDAHKKYMIMAMNGRGVDRHLLGLKLLAAKNAIDVSDFYADAGFVKSAHMRLSTSQVASKYEAVMCYGPLVENGYGCCYNPRDNDMLFAISSFESCQETEAKRFGAAMRDSLMGMYNLLVATNNNNNNNKSKL